MKITDKPGSFQHTNVFEAGISDHHKLVTTVLKAKFTKASPKMFITAITKILINKILN